MIRFVYPNVIPKEKLFIGCGRYGVFPHENIPAGYKEQEESPLTPNRLHLEWAAELLAPESFDSSEIICEMQDEPERRYQGDSLDFAWVLAHISRSRKIRDRWKSLNADIWCTGLIQVRELHPMLHKVESTGFDLKLSAFLSRRNSNLLFVVPTANITKTHLEQIAEAGAQVLSLTQFQEKGLEDQTEKKTVLKVLPGELPQLTDFLFEKKERKKQGFRIPVLLLVLFTTLLGLHYWQSAKITAPDILICLEKGDFSQAEKMMEKAELQNTDMQVLRDQMSADISTEIFFQYQKTGQAPSEFYPVSSPDLREIVLTHRDNYRLKLESKSQNQPVYLYVFQKDHRGNVDWIFPNPTWKPEKNNPLSPDSFPCFIPPEKTDWMYMDELSPETGGIFPEETLFMTASPWKASDIENLYGEICKETDSAKRNEQIGRFVRQLEKRKDAGLPAVVYQKLSFQHGE